jgi:hypothetical protein
MAKKKTIKKKHKETKEEKALRLHKKKVTKQFLKIEKDYIKLSLKISKVETKKLEKKLIAIGKLEAIYEDAIFPEYTFNKKARKISERYDFGLINTSAKKNWFCYRDWHTGRYIAKKDIRGKKVHVELWRYSLDSPHKFKRIWIEKRYTTRQKPIPHETEQLILMGFYRRNHSKVIWDSDLKCWVAFTHSP